MKISEIAVRGPQKPLTPAQARVQALRTRVKTAQDALKREREAQRRSKALERQRKAAADLTPKVR